MGNDGHLNSTTPNVIFFVIAFIILNIKNMKKLNHFIALASCALMISQSSSAQKDSSGIYKTVQDFRQKKLTYAINYKTEKHKVKDDMLFSEGEIKINHGVNVYTLNKNDTYG